MGFSPISLPDIVSTVERALREISGAGTASLSGPATPVLATYLGVGAWGVAYMVEDAHPTDG